MESELKDPAQKPAYFPPESDGNPLLEPEPSTPRPQIPVSNQSIEELEKKYAPFVRYDVYGPMGRGELPWVEKFLLGLALVFLVPIRVVAAVNMLVLYYVICRVCTAFLAPNREDGQEDYAHMGGWRRAVIMQSGRFLSRVLLFVFGFYSISEVRRGIEIDGEFNNEVEILLLFSGLISLVLLWMALNCLISGYCLVALNTGSLLSIIEWISIYN